MLIEILRKQNKQLAHLRKDVAGTLEKLMISAGPFTKNRN